MLFSTPISLSAIIMSVKSQFSSGLINSIIALCLYSTNTVLKYLTVNINAKNISEEKPHICSATGFYAITNNIPVLVTARHFVIPT